MPRSSVSPRRRPEENPHHHAPLESTELATGAIVRLEGLELRIGEPIGRGSFGAVWGAEAYSDTYQGEVAIKEIACRSQPELDAAIKEAQLLRVLSEEICAYEVSTRLPKLLALGVEDQRVRMAMSRLPGGTLERFIAARTGSRRGTSAGPRRRLEACRIARELLLQLMPVMDFVSRSAFHRDAHVRNITIQEMENGPPLLGLVDFGLAVGVAHWREGNWRTEGVAGDCRYWPPSAWLMLEHGPTALDADPERQLEYEARLDLHSLGLTALQVLAELSAGDDLPDDDDLGVAWRRLRSAWSAYWADATRLWMRVYTILSNGAGGFDGLRAELIAEGVHQIIADHLQALRRAMRGLRAVVDAQADDAREAADAAAIRSGSDLALLLDVILAMLGASREAVPQWSDLHSLLTGKAPYSVQQALTHPPHGQQPRSRPHSRPQTPQRLQAEHAACRELDAELKAGVPMHDVSPRPQAQMEAIVDLHASEKLQHHQAQEVQQEIESHVQAQQPPCLESGQPPPPQDNVEQPTVLDDQQQQLQQQQELQCTLDGAVAPELVHQHPLTPGRRLPLCRDPQGADEEAPGPPMSPRDALASDDVGFEAASPVSHGGRHASPESAMSRSGSAVDLSASTAGRRGSRRRGAAPRQSSPSGGDLGSPKPGARPSGATPITTAPNSPARSLCSSTSTSTPSLDLPAKLNGRYMYALGARQSIARFPGCGPRGRPA